MTERYVFCWDYSNGVDNWSLELEDSSSDGLKAKVERFNSLLAIDILNDVNSSFLIRREENELVNWQDFMNVVDEQVVVDDGVDVNEYAGRDYLKETFVLYKDYLHGEKYHHLGWKAFHEYALASFFHEFNRAGKLSDDKIVLIAKILGRKESSIVAKVRGYAGYSRSNCRTLKKSSIVALRTEKLPKGIPDMLVHPLFANIFGGELKRCIDGDSLDAYNSGIKMGIVNGNQWRDFCSNVKNNSSLIASLFGVENYFHVYSVDNRHMIKYDEKFIGVD